jgi:glucan biosynthesis protein C
LTALLIYHHAAITYSGAGQSAYQSTLHPPFSSVALVGFNAFNQRLFMGSFMYLAGYFSRKALHKKSTRQFVKDGVYRLALPSEAYTILGAPMCVIMVRSWNGKDVSWRWMVEYMKEQRGIHGPVWFTATLCCFDLAMAGLEVLHKRFLASPSTTTEPTTTESKETVTQKHSGRPQPLQLYTSLMLCSVGDFLLRTVFPVGAFLNPLNLQPAFVSQYVAAYVFGTRVSHIEDAIPSYWSASGLALISTFLTYVLGQSLGQSPDSMLKMKGGWNSLAVIYAVWGNFNGCALSALVFAGFAKTGLCSFEHANAYAFPAFLVHMPVMTVVGLSSDAWKAGLLKRTMVVSIVLVVRSRIV